jgi:hypothetical protein
VKIALRILFLAAVILAAGWLWAILFPSPEKMIRRQLLEVAKDTSFQPNQNPLVIANNAEKLAACFSTNVEVNLSEPGREEHMLSGREEIMQAAAAAHSEVRSLKVELLDVSVSVSADKQSGTASATVKVNSSRENDEILQPMKFTFQKFGHDWLITRVETLRSLS